jgi:Rrf2 family protein
MLSQTAEYALRAVLAIAAQPNGQPIGAARLAGVLRVPRNYLSKTLYQLAQAGVLESSRGRQGGFQLAAPAERISLFDIVKPFDEVLGQQRCLMGRPACSDQNPCQAHHRWKAVSQKAVEFFRETTVADLARRRDKP